MNIELIPCSRVLSVRGPWPGCFALLRRRALRFGALCFIAGFCAGFLFFELRFFAGFDELREAALAASIRLVAAICAGDLRAFFFAIAWSKHGFGRFTSKAGKTLGLAASPGRLFGWLRYGDPRVLRAQREWATAVSGGYGWK